jgi:hypothetical protein
VILLAPLKDRFPGQLMISAFNLSKAQGSAHGLPWAERREDKEDVGDLFCPGFAAKSRSICKFSSLP